MQQTLHKIDLLTPNAQERFERLQDERNLLFGQSRTQHAEASTLRSTIQRREQLFRQALVSRNLLNDRGQNLETVVADLGDKLPDPQDSEWSEIQRLKANLQKLTKRKFDRDAANEDFLQMTGKLEAFIEEMPSEIEVVDIRPKRFGKLPSLQKAQAEVDRLAAEKESIKDAPFTAAEIKELTIAKIEKIAEFGRPSLSYSFDACQAPELFNTHLKSNSGLSKQELDNAFWVWLRKDEIIERLLQEISNSADDENAIAKDQRQKRFQKASNALLDAERVEVLATDAERSDGRYRACLSPEAILMIELTSSK